VACKSHNMFIWIEKGPLCQLPRSVLPITTAGFEAFELSCWVCVDEVRDVLNLIDKWRARD
jgi:hypothetical protein